MKCNYQHVERTAGDLGGNVFCIDLNLQTDDENIYQRVVVAISNALGYPMVKEDKRPVLGFHADPPEEVCSDDDVE